ncbi:C6 transcription factor [Pochonia chlamydosporia 170]|uniref:C6 transcription factor n=1 Tax=Pochonia chlamydosporia 170 TaxID=1380566 RepID=A0A179FU89_METCM|nr:C6 transcription factor [Pochonia chlamydosporia 170]OAQ69226.1 C6 transcription factor [Pochonia chlamydosporia 170]
MKQMYYWTIMLLTRPFLIERVVAHVNQTMHQTAQQSEGLRPCALPDLSKTLVYACVNSAIKTIKLLEPLTQQPDLPGRLPLLINAAFHSALVVGFAHFGDLYLVFPLAKYIHVAHSILLKFADDPVASRNSTIIGYLMEVCQVHIEKRHAASMDVECEAIGKLFGQIDQRQSHDHPNSDRLKHAQKLGQGVIEEADAYRQPFGNGQPSGGGTLTQNTFTDNQMSNAMGDSGSIYGGSVVSQSPPQPVPGLEPFAPMPTVLDSSLLGNPQLFWLDFDNDISSLFTIIGPNS